MRRTIYIGVFLFVLFVVVFAPAGLVRSLLAPVQDVQLLNPSGTLWRGAGELYLAERPAGQLQWRFSPGTILQGYLGYHLTLTAPDQMLEGNVGIAPGRIRFDVEGTLSSRYINQWLAPYEISMSGDVNLADVKVELSRNRQEAESGTPAQPAMAAGRASGSLLWSGGNVHYRLSGQEYQGQLPPLVARLGEALEAYIYPQQGQTPLLVAQILDNGFVKIGMTRLLTKLLNNPWPGSDVDHEVVLEVEEQIF